MRWLTFTLMRVFRLHPVYAQLWAHLLIYVVLIPSVIIGGWLTLLKALQ